MIRTIRPLVCAALSPAPGSDLGVGRNDRGGGLRGDPPVLEGPIRLPGGGNPPASGNNLSTARGRVNGLVPILCPRFAPGPGGFLPFPIPLAHEEGEVVEHVLDPSSGPRFSFDLASLDGVQGPRQGDERPGRRDRGVVAR